MRYLILFLSSITVFVSCTQDVYTEYPNSQQKENNGLSQIRTFDEAFEVAQDAISLLDSNSLTRSANLRKISLPKTKVYKVENTTRSGKSDGDTLLYVFNFEENQGFAIISASKNTEAVLAITESGNCDPNARKGIEGFDLFLKAAKEYVLHYPQLRIQEPAFLTKDSLVNISHQQQGPFVAVEWGQYHPEGEFCPNGIAGCANTAVAQIMSYYDYPTSISLTYPNADVSSQSLNWNAMKAHPTGHLVNSCQTQSVHKSIGRLHRQLGYLTQSEYNSNATSTPQMNIMPVLLQLNYNTTGDWLSYDWDSIANHLDNQHLLLVGGYENLWNGHFWVLDGFIETVYTYQHYVYGIGLENGWVLTGTTHEHSKLCHYNWGWYGDCNGYFSPNVFNTQAADVYNNPDSHSQEHDYSFYVNILPIWR